jgi:hypothetical protein
MSANLSSVPVQTVLAPALVSLTLKVMKRKILRDLKNWRQINTEPNDKFKN